MDKWYWVINPVTKEWIVNVGDTGYTFFNKKVWDDFSMFYPTDDMVSSIQKWVLHKMDVPSSKHCYPDCIDREYDWRDEFYEEDVIDVITNGKLIPEKNLTQ